MYVNHYNRNFRNGVVVNHDMGDFGQKEVDNKFLQNPEYPHSQDARDLWWNKLQTWGNDPNYGAISPDWDNIWNTVQNRVKQYYEGGPLNPGVKDRLRSSLARRGMSENPASDYLMAQTDAQQSGELNDLATQQAMAKVNLANSGRETWLNSLQNFQAQRPAGEWQTTVSSKNPWLDWGVNTAGNVATAYATGGIANGAMQELNKTLQTSQYRPQGYAPTSSDNAWWNYMHS